MIVALLGFYVNYFGTSLSSKHASWAEFGAFFGGVWTSPKTLDTP